MTEIGSTFCIPIFVPDFSIIPFSIASFAEAATVHHFIDVLAARCLIFFTELTITAFAHASRVMRSILVSAIYDIFKWPTSSFLNFLGCFMLFRDRLRVIMWVGSGEVRQAHQQELLFLFPYVVWPLDFLLVKFEIKPQNLFWAVIILRA